MSRKYNRIRDLGQGAKGAVILAINTLTGEHVAIKIYDDPEASLQETNMLRTLPYSPHLPRYIESFSLGDKTCVVQNYIEGNELFDYIDRPSLSLQFLNNLLTQMIETLQNLHRLGIVHRDIKTENIMVNTIMMNFTLIDFDAACTGPDCMKPSGTIGFISPQLINVYGQYLNYGIPLPQLRRIYETGDVFSLGVVMYVMMEKNEPFQLYPDSDLIPNNFTHFHDFSKPRPMTYPDARLVNIVQMMLTGNATADDIIIEMTRAY